MKRRWLLIPIGFLALTACQAPTPIAPAATPTVRSIVNAATNTPAATVPPPTNTPLPAATPAPTTTPVATAAATAAATASATAAVTPQATATPTATAAATAAPTQAPASNTRAVFINVDSANFRDGPSTTANVITVLTQGTALTAIDQPTAPDAGGIAWQNVRTADGRSGWVGAQFLSAAPVAAPTPVTTPVSSTIATIVPPGFVYVAATDGLNLRAEHSASSKLLTTLNNGQRLKTNGLGFGPDDFAITWLNIKTDDDRLEGWVSVEFISTIVPSVAPAQPPVNEADIAAELLRRTNALRQQNGLPPYTLHDGLNALALEHSQYMAQNGVTHIDGNGVSASRRIANAGFAGRPTENIYGGLASIEDTWEYWSQDPPHLQNLLNPVNTLIGIGVFKTGPGVYYYTQDFAGPLN